MNSKMGEDGMGVEKSLYTRTYKLFAVEIPPRKVALRREDFDRAVRHGIQRYSDSKKAGFIPRLGGGPAPHIVGAAGEVVVERLGRLAGLMWTETPFKVDYTSRPTRYDFRAGNWTIDVKVQFCESEPTNVLVPLAQAEGSDLYLFAALRIAVNLLGFAWRGDLKRYGEVDYNLPLPAYRLKVAKLRPIDELWRLLRG